MIQYEFNAKSRLLDVFPGLRAAATEKCFQNVSYKAIITPFGKELSQDEVLATCDNKFVIAVPESDEESFENYADIVPC